MKIHQICTTLALAGTFAAVSGCKDFYNVNVSPLYPTSTTLNTLLPVTQVSLASDLGDNVGGLSQYTMGLMQQLYSPRGINNFNQTGGSFGGPWSDLYTSMLINNQIIIDQGTKEGQWGYVGVAQLQKAYAFSQMVDLWGDIPYSEALKGAANVAPRFDKDADIYNGSADGSIQGLFSLIDEGLANLAKAPNSATLGSADLFYKGDLDKWARFGRTLKLKLYNQIRKTNSSATVISQVTPLLNSPLMLESGDLQLNYSTSINPDNRNPGFVIDYNSNPENRIGQYFYLGMRDRNDPRLRYYFFNQIKEGSTTTGQDYINGNFVTVRPGSTGQFTSTATTAGVQTLQGLYPIGGRYDDGRGSTGIPVAKGVAPQRLLTYYARKYTEAELQLVVLNNPAAARVAFVEGLAASFRKVNAIAAVDGSPTLPATRAAITVTADTAKNVASYTRAALDRYDFVRFGGTTPPRATTTEEKLEAIMYEKYVASFGYGVDVYTDFRRTHHPQIRVSQGAADASRGLLPDDGGTLSQGIFPYRFFYPTSDLILNPNSPRTQAPLTSRIFWDR